jgi:hypothetical protein
MPKQELQVLENAHLGYVVPVRTTAIVAQIISDDLRQQQTCTNTLYHTRLMPNGQLLQHFRNGLLMQQSTFHTPKYPVSQPTGHTHWSASGRPGNK